MQGNVWLYFSQPKQIQEKAQNILRKRAYKSKGNPQCLSKQEAEAKMTANNVWHVIEIDGEEVFKRQEPFQDYTLRTLSYCFDTHYPEIIDSGEQVVYRFVTGRRTGEVRE